MFGITGQENLNCNKYAHNNDGESGKLPSFLCYALITQTVLNRQRENELGIFAHFAACVYMPAVKLNDGLAKIKPETRALDVKASRFILLIESLKDFIKLVGRDSFAAVSYLYYNLLGVTL